VARNCFSEDWVNNCNEAVSIFGTTTVTFAILSIVGLGREELYFGGYCKGEELRLGVDGNQIKFIPLFTIRLLSPDLIMI
jgi:hypothetical protein